MELLILLPAAIVFIVVGTSKLNLHPFLALLLAGIGYGVLCGSLSLEEVVDSIHRGFGGTIGSIGIVIVAGSIIGTFLEKSGGAEVVAERTLKITGEKNVPLAMGVVGYFVSIPVFCDSGFVILSPLCRSLSKRAGVTLTSGAVALSLGLYATHTMVPPTPGPVAAAGILEADLGRVILFGAVASAFALFVGWIFAVLIASKVRIDPGTSLRGAEESQPHVPIQPTLVHSVFPILLPIFLIVLRSLSQLPGRPLGEGVLTSWVEFFGQPTIALLAGVLVAFSLPGRSDHERLSAGGWVGEAVLNAAAIIVITGAGGAFGKVLQNSGIGAPVESLFSGGGIGIWLPFFLAAALKTAQGSSTVAIVTSAGIVAPLLPSLGLDTESARALVVVAIGAGSMVVSHANDSFFWVVTQMTGMTVGQGYKLQTFGTLVEGTAAAVGVWLLGFLVL